MVCMFKTYFKLASNNNTGGPLAFVVAEIAFKVAVVTSSVDMITLVDRNHFLSG